MTHPQVKPPTKRQRNLAARIKAWEELPIEDKGRENGFTKPGSNNK